MLRGARFSDTLTHSVTHILIDEACDVALKTPKDFLERLAAERGPKIDFSWLRQSLARQSIALVALRSSDTDALPHCILFSSQLEAPETLYHDQSPVQLLEGIPQFAQKSLVSTMSGYQILSVDDWPWFDYITEVRSPWSAPQETPSFSEGSVDGRRLTALLMSSIPRRRPRRSPAPTKYHISKTRTTTPPSKTTKPPEDTANKDPAGVFQCIV